MRSFLFFLVLSVGVVVGPPTAFGGDLAALRCPAGSVPTHALQKGPLRPHWLVVRFELVEADWCQRNGVRNGTYLGYRTGHRLAEKSYYKDGKLDGQSQHFDVAGKTVAEARFKEGKLDGPFVLFYPSGAIRLKGRFVVDRPDGTWTGYYPSGSKAVVYRFDNGARVGSWRSFDPDGRRLKEASGGDTRWKFLPPDQWKKDGLEVESSLSAEVPEFRKETLCCPPGSHQEDKVDGESLLASECRNGSGVHGPYVQYYVDGEIKAEGAYFEGRAHGRTVLYHPNGQPMAMGVIQAGSPCGVWRCFGADGRQKDCPSDLTNKPACFGGGK